jgi:hypothetical protein
VIIPALIASLDVDEDENEEDEVDEKTTRTELDSHANMVVAGKGALVLNDTGKSAQVSAFSPDVDPMKEVPIVDVAILYIDPYTGKRWIKHEEQACSHLSATRSRREGARNPEDSLQRPY